MSANIGVLTQNPTKMMELISDGLIEDQIQV
jgi:hypothetical protein